MKICVQPCLACARNQLIFQQAQGELAASQLALQGAVCYSMPMHAVSSILLEVALPLSRLLVALCLGLLVANVVEALGIARQLGRWCAPLARHARLSEVSGAAFALAFFSPSAANAMLAEQYEQGALSARELMLTNLFNSLPAYLVHLPTMVLLIWPVLGTPALVYVGLTLAAAALRTGLTVVLGRLCLPVPHALPTSPATALAPAPHGVQAWKSAWAVAWKRFTRRIPRLLGFTIPIYIGMVLMQRAGWFAVLEHWLAGQSVWGALIKPQALSIMVLSLLAEVGASISAAGAALHQGGLNHADVVLALLIGNILSTPIRAIRHQFPAYAGYFRPKLALRLIVANQGLRTLSLCLMAWLYWTLG